MLRPNAMTIKLAALAIVLSWTTYALADEASGTVNSVDASHHEFTLKGVVKNTTYGVEKDATIYLDGLKAKFDQLKEGDKVNIAYVKSGDRMNVNYIRALRSCSETTGDIKDVYLEKKQVTLKGVVKDTTYEMGKDSTV